MVVARSVRIAVGYAPVRGPILAAASLLTDNFDDNVRSSSWAVGALYLARGVSTSTVSEANARTEVTPAASGGSTTGLISVANYDMFGDAVFVKVTNTVPLDTTMQPNLCFGQDINNRYAAVLSGPSLYLQEIAGGSLVQTSIVYDATTHAWWRLRHSASLDTVYLDTAPASASNPPAPGDWVQQLSRARSPLISVQSALLSFGVDTTGSPAALTTIYFDGFNTGTTSTADVTVALTGLSLSAAIGSVLPVTTLPLTGAALTAAQGSVAPQTAPPLIGLSLVAAQGSVSPSTTVALTGQALTASAGTVVATLSLPLTGQSVSVAQGSVGSARSIVLAGQSASVSQGTVGPALSVGIAGLLVTAAAGSLTPAISAALAGLALAVTRGSVAPSLTRALTGQSLSLARGFVTVSLSGGQIKVYLGSFTAKPVKWWDGAAWTTKPIKYWNGAGWVPTS